MSVIGISVHDIIKIPFKRRNSIIYDNYKIIIQISLYNESFEEINKTIQSIMKQEFEY